MSLTSALLASDKAAFTRATTSPFLTSAARGQTPKPLLSRWLANDRLYIHAYIAGSGRLLSLLSLPQAAVPVGSAPDPTTRLLDWIVGALVNIRREEGFFLSTAANFGLDVDLPLTASGNVLDEDKLEGLRRWERLFRGFPAGPAGEPLPWLEGAVVFWGTEICYLEAWTGVRDELDPQGKAEEDADGGALRSEFIPNWTNEDFRKFVNDVRDIIDDAVEEEVKLHGEGVRAKLVERALVPWREVLAAEETFWPAA